MEDQKKASHDGPVIGVGILFIAVVVFALVGTLLGAINFVSPAHYPAWILVMWLVMNILLELFLLGHMAIYLIKVFSDYEADDPLPVFTTIVSLTVLIGGVTLLVERHFGWYSVIALGCVCLMAFIDFLWWARVDGKKVAKE